jgi:hypothetical protein
VSELVGRSESVRRFLFCGFMLTGCKGLGGEPMNVFNSGSDEAVGGLVVRVQYSYNARI